MNPKAGYGRLEIKNIDSVTVVRLSDQFLDSHLTIVEVSEELFRLVDEVGCCNIMLDLCEVQSLSNIMIGKLVQLKNKIWPRGGRLVLIDMHPNVLQLFVVAKLNGLFAIRGSMSEGLAVFEA